MDTKSNANGYEARRRKFVERALQVGDLTAGYEVVDCDCYYAGCTGFRVQQTNDALRRGERKQATSVRLSPTLLAFLASCEDSAGNVIEDTIRRSAAFKRWSKDAT